MVEPVAREKSVISIYFLSRTPFLSEFMVMNRGNDLFQGIFIPFRPERHSSYQSTFV